MRSAEMRRQSKLTSASVRRGAPVAIFAVMTALNLSPSGAGRREENTSAISVWPVRRTLMQKHLFSSTSGNAEEEALRQVSIVGRAPSAEIDVIAETVTPPRPAGPSVVTTETEAADRLIPSRKASRSAWSAVLSFICLVHSGLCDALLARSGRSGQVWSAS